MVAYFNRTRHLMLTGYAELIPELRRLAADPSISHTAAWRDYLHIGHAKLYELLDEHNIPWVEEPMLHINARRQEQTRRRREELLPLIRQLAADPAVTKEAALRQLGIGHKALNAILHVAEIRWVRPEIRPRSPRPYERRGAMLNAFGVNPAKGGAAAQQRTTRDQKTVRKLLGYMCPNLSKIWAENDISWYINSKEKNVGD